MIKTPQSKLHFFASAQREREGRAKEPERPRDGQLSAGLSLKISMKKKLEAAGAKVEFK